MPFVVSTGLEKPDPEVRKLIRSHVMLGKNQGKTRRPKRREARELADKSSSVTDLGGPSGSLITASRTVIPQKIGSDLLTIRFADAVEPYMVEIFLQCELIGLQPHPQRFTYLTSKLPVSAVHNAHTIHRHTSLLHF